MTAPEPLLAADFAALLLFAVPPSDRALAGWGLGMWPERVLRAAAAGRDVGGDLLADLVTSSGMVRA